MKISDCKFIKTVFDDFGVDWVNLFESPTGTFLIMYWATPVKLAEIENGEVVSFAVDRYNVFETDPTKIFEIPVREWMRNSTAVYTFETDSDELIPTTFEKLDPLTIPDEGHILAEGF